MKKTTVLITTMLVVVGIAWASMLTSAPLERLITLDRGTLTLENALKAIESEAEIKFSYNPSRFNTQREVNLRYERKSVRWVLDDLFQGRVKYKTRGKYVVLQPREDLKKVMEPPKDIHLSGYILDAGTGEKIPNVTLYDSISLKSTLSNVHGHFEFFLHPKTEKVKLLIRKDGYFDTSLKLDKRGFKLLLIPMNPLVVVPHDTALKQRVEMPAQADTMEQDSSWFSFLNDLNLKEEIPAALKKVKTWFSKDFIQHDRNIKDTLHRDFQVSLLPGISSNGFLAGRVRNDFSFNVLGGYSAGNNVFELGGLFNLNNGSVEGAQIAGIFNGVNSSVSGFQVGGILNVVREEVNGVQVGGIANVDGKVNGAAIGGIINIADSVDGAQIAGIGNVANRSQGIQVGGIFNAASRHNGVQIGLVNIADSMHGVGIGFFNFVRYGYHKLELGYDELTPYRISFRTGTRAFHNIFTYGVNTISSPVYSKIGYGLGTSFKLAKWLSMDIDLTAYRLQGENYNADWEYFNNNGELFLGFDIHLFKKFSIAAGPTLNFYAVDRAHPQYQETFSQLRPQYQWRGDLGNNLEGFSWFGVRTAVRFF